MGGLTALVWTLLVVWTGLSWRYAFWAFGGVGVLWCVGFAYWFRNRPEERPEVNDAERGAHAIEYAATQDLPRGSYVGPGGLGHLRGYPEVHEPSRPPKIRKRLGGCGSSLPRRAALALAGDRDGAGVDHRHGLDAVALPAELGPGVTLHFILGADELGDLPNWSQPARIAALARLAVLHEGRIKPFDTLAREELGLDVAQFENPMREGLVAGISTLIGGAIPVAGYLLGRLLLGAVVNGFAALAIAFVVSAFFLFAIGSARSFFTGKGGIKSGLEMLAVGSVVAALTYGVGLLFRA